MSDRIKIDPDNLESMSIIMENATDALSEAVTLMMQIVSHRDWTCKERKKINEEIENIQKAVKIILFWGSAFAKVVRLVLKRLREKENRLSGIFEAIDSIIGRIIGIKPSTIITEGQNIINTITGNNNGSDGNNGSAIADVVESAGSIITQTTNGTTNNPIQWRPSWEPIYGSNGEIIAWPKSATVSDVSTVADPISTVDFSSVEL